MVEKLNNAYLDQEEEREGTIETERKVPSTSSSI